MEFMLLWVDDLDDAVGALRHLAPKIGGFLLAVALFAATGYALVIEPQITLAVLGVVLSVSLAETLRRRSVAARKATSY
jgi:CRISPR/Cas system-associated exonuclease Cas4 (RecB family)